MYFNRETRRYEGRWYENYIIPQHHPLFPWGLCWIDLICALAGVPCMCLFLCVFAAAFG